LKDKAPYVEYSKVKKIFQEEFGKNPEDMFIEFESEPVASASIAQVHKAKLKDGTPVAVKVQVPRYYLDIKYLKETFYQKTVCLGFGSLQVDCLSLREAVRYSNLLDSGVHRIQSEKGG
jgi:hypothetical protein